MIRKLLFIAAGFIAGYSYHASTSLKSKYDGSAYNPNEVKKIVGESIEEANSYERKTEEGK